MCISDILCGEWEVQRFADIAVQKNTAKRTMKRRLFSSSSVLRLIDGFELSAAKWSSSAVKWSSE